MGINGDVCAAFGGGTRIGAEVQLPCERGEVGVEAGAWRGPPPALVSLTASLPSSDTGSVPDGPGITCWGVMAAKPQPRTAGKKLPIPLCAGSGYEFKI